MYSPYHCTLPISGRIALDDHRSKHQDTLVKAAHDSCPVCGNAELTTIRGYERAHLAKCNSCGLVFSRRIPTADELDAFYADYPYKDDIAPITLSRYNELLGKFEPLRQQGNILDVGCGSGAFLMQAKSKGWNVFGTEYGDGAVEDCRERGITMHKGPLRLEDHGSSTFDVITSFEVAEHLIYPADIVNICQQLLRPGGLLYLTTPNFNSLSRSVIGSDWSIINYPEHVSYFTPRSMHRMLVQAGFKKQELRTTGISPMRMKLSMGLATKPNHDSGNDDEVLRSKLEGSAMLRVAKSMVNNTLSLLGKGDTIKALYQKPLSGGTSARQG